jgi:hypothetical protein
VLPVFAIVLWHPAMLPAPVPKTSINEHCQAFAAKNKIWFSFNLSISAPADNAIGSENRDQFEFRVSVSARFDSGHNLRPLPF